MAEILIPDQFSEQQESGLQKDNTAVATIELQPSAKDRVALEPTKLFEVSESGEIHTEWAHNTPMEGSIVYAVVWASLDANCPQIRRSIQAKLWGVVLGIPAPSWLKGDLYYDNLDNISGDVHLVLESAPTYARIQFYKGGSHVGTWHTFQGGLPITGVMTGDSSWRSY